MPEPLTPEELKTLIVDLAADGYLSPGWAIVLITYFDLVHV